MILQSVFMFPKFKRYANTKVCPRRVYKRLPSSFTHSFVVPFIAIHVSPSQQFGFRFLGIAHRWFSFWHSVHRKFYKKNVKKAFVNIITVVVLRRETSQFRSISSIPTALAAVTGRQDSNLSKFHSNQSPFK